VFCELTLRPSAIEVLTLSIFAPQLHQRQLHLGSSFVQQGAEPKRRAFCALKLIPEAVSSSNSAKKKRPN
jgi:hypothetical protein